MGENEPSAFIEDLRIELLGLAIDHFRGTAGTTPKEIVSAAKEFEDYLNLPTKQEKEQEDEQQSRANRRLN